MAQAQLHFKETNKLSADAERALNQVHSKSKIALMGLFLSSAVALSGCGSSVVTNISTTQAASPAVSISPNIAQVAANQGIQFAASVSGDSSEPISWAVNGVSGGTAATGIITASGYYQAPTSAVSGQSISITATSKDNSSQAATATLTVQNTVTVNPEVPSVGLGETQQFSAAVNGVAGAQVTWSVSGISGGNATVGTISATGLYVAPVTSTSSSVQVIATDAADHTASAAATVALFNPQLLAAHNNWIAGVAGAAASYGCTDVSVQQQQTETIPEVIERFATEAGKGSCLVLWPVSTNPAITRYSFAWGGTVNGKSILYLSDISQMRIWNGAQVANN